MTNTRGKLQKKDNNDQVVKYFIAQRNRIYKKLMCKFMCFSNSIIFHLNLSLDIIGCFDFSIDIFCTYTLSFYIP
jgi:hypothetical protein